MIIELDDRSPVPPYEQLRSQIVALVQTGGLVAGTRLPSIRQLANDLGVAGGTVARAYRELEAAGVVETRGRHGTVVADALSAAVDTSTSDELVDAARSFAERVGSLGVDLDEAVAVLRVVATDPNLAEGTA